MLYRIGIFGLMLMLVSCAGSRNGLTFTDDIAPLVHRKCSPCHIAGQAAPFELISYQDFSKRPKLIRSTISQRLMPPWPADASYRHFANEYALTDEERGRILTWIEEKMPEGKPTSYPMDALVRELNLGIPDLIIPLPKIPIQGNNKDLFIVMKVPYEIPQDTFIRAVEFVAGNSRLVHHVNIHLIQYDPDKKRNIHEGKEWVLQDQANSQTIHRELGMLQDDGSYPAMTPSISNYLPGAHFTFYPEQIGGYRMSRKGALYLNDFHYGPSPVDTSDASFVRIYFAPSPPVRPLSEFQMGTLGITPVIPDLVIPANQRKTFHIQATIPDDISLVNIVPHMHLIGKRYLAFAVKPSGDTIPLVRIPEWDFRWQYFYTFQKLLHLPRGTTIYVEGEFDNTSDNPNNPFSPPQEIRDRNGSMKTTDEMFQFIVTYLPYKQGDEEISLEEMTGSE